MRLKDVVMVGVWLACAGWAPAQTFRVLDVRLDVGAGRAVDSRGVWLDEHDLWLYLDDGALLRLTLVQNVAAYGGNPNASLRLGIRAGRTRVERQAGRFGRLRPETSRPIPSATMAPVAGSGTRIAARVTEPTTPSRKLDTLSLYSARDHVPASHLPTGHSTAPYVPPGWYIGYQLSTLENPDAGATNRYVSVPSNRPVPAPIRVREGSRVEFDFQREE
jgi:hypothetical protein